MRAPGVARSSVATAAHMSVDLTATCVAAANAKPDVALDGVSLFDVATNAQRFADRHLLYQRDNRDDQPGMNCPPATGVFTTTRKLVRWQTDPPVYELYDLDRDPTALTNVADDPAYASDRASLEHELDVLLKR
jgi:arylsulfatase A-like enzyme